MMQWAKRYQARDISLALLALVIFGIDLLLPPGRAVIVMLVPLVVFGCQTMKPGRIIGWAAFCVVLTAIGYFIRHGLSFSPAYLVRRGICILALILGAGVAVRSALLEEARRKHAAKLEKAAAAIFIRNEDGRIDAWSQGAELLYGWTANDAIGERIDDLFGDQDAVVAAAAATKMAADGRWRGELIRRKADGTCITVLCQWAAQGRPHGAAVLESNTDITAFKRTETHLRDSEAHFKGIFEMAGFAIWELDYTPVSAWFRHLREIGISDFRKFFQEHGATIREVLGKVKVISFNNAAAILLQDSSVRGDILLRCPDEIVAMFLEAAIGGKQTFNTETIFMTLRGEQRFVLLSETFGLHDGTSWRVLMSATDITERKRAENELILLKRNLSQVTRSATLGELTALVESELEHPLATIVACSRRASETLQSGEGDLARLTETIRSLIDEAKKASGIVKDIRNFLRRNSGNAAPIAVGTAVEAAVSLLAPELETYDVHLAVTVEAGLPEISGESGWLEHVVLYLLLSWSQALTRAKNLDRELQLAVFQENRDIVLCFRHTGGGIENFGINDPGLGICTACVESQGGRIIWSFSGNSREIRVVFPFTGARLGG